MEKRKNNRINTMISVSYSYGMRFIKEFAHIFVILLAGISISFPVWAGPIGPHAERIANTGKGNFAGGQFARTFERVVDGQVKTFAHIFIDADRNSITALRALGVEINTITPNRIMTAIAPVAKLKAIAAVAGVRKIEAGHSVKMFMDMGAGPDGVNLPNTAFPRDANTGAGVIVGVIDTGIDIEHPDFIDSEGTRIISIWDHTLDTEDVGGAADAPPGFTYGTEWPRDLIQGGYSACLHRDNHGHGTHVAGTAAGNGSANSEAGPYTGLAPKAELLIVKFDFDNEKDRNTTTAILDGINWIFQKAAAAGKPCVINMSLGSDYGPHDGSTIEERGIDDLVGTNKIVCVAAGNAAVKYDGIAFESWGAPIHGSGNSVTAQDIVLETSTDYAPSNADDYIFFDVWYPGSDTCRVQITTPDGIKYPPNFERFYRNLWKTDGISRGFSTSEGFIYVANTSSASSFWETDNGDNNIWIEITDFNGINPAQGQWKIEIIPLSGIGEYNAWHGFSSSLRKTFFWYDSGGSLSEDYLSDSIMTIGKPATALDVISVGAYQTKNEWPARLYDNWENPFSDFSLIRQDYETPPIDYYDPFVMHYLAFFSSRGPSRDGRIQPFISAPGVGIVASLSQTTLNASDEDYYRKLNRVEYGGYHATLQGTSMSCPHATGSVALLLEEANNQGITPGPAEIKRYLEQGSRVDGFTGTSPNNDWGHGKIDVSNSLLAIQPAPLTITTETLPDGIINEFYSAALTAEGGTPSYTWSISVGSLPDGLNLNSADGVISGTPETEGTSNFDVEVADSSDPMNTKAKSLSIAITGVTLAPEVIECVPNTGNPGAKLSVVISGNNFQAGATVSFGSGIAVQTTTVNTTSDEITCRIRISRKAATGSRTVTVTNPGGEDGILLNGFEVE